MSTLGLSSIAPARSIEQELMVSAGSIEEWMGSHILVTVPAGISLIDILQQSPKKMFSRGGKMWLETAAIGQPFLVKKTTESKRWLVGKGNRKAFRANSFDPDHVTPHSTVYPEGTFEGQKEMLFGGEIVLPPLVLIWVLLAYIRAREKWIPKAEQYFLRTAAIINPAVDAHDRLCVGVEEGEIVFRPLPDRLANSHYVLATGQVWKGGPSQLSLVK